MRSRWLLRVLTIPLVVAAVLLIVPSPALGSCADSGSTRASTLRAAVDGLYNERSLDTVLVGVVTGTGEPFQAGNENSPHAVFPLGMYTPRSVRVLADFRGGASQSVTLLVRGGHGNGLVESTSDGVPQLHEGALSLIVGRRTGEGTLVLGTCTPSGTLTAGELSMLLSHRPHAVVYDHSLAGAVAVTGAGTSELTYVGGGLVGIGAAMLLTLRMTARQRVRA